MRRTTRKKFDAFKVDWGEHQGLVHKLCYKVNNRVKAAKISGVEYEDLVQEAGIVYTKCASRFDPAQGITFTAYFGRAIINRLNQVLEVQERICPPTVNHSEAEDVGEESDIDILMDLNTSTASLSDGAHDVLALLVHHPEFVREEFAASCSKALKQRQMMHKVHQPVVLSARFVAQSILGYTRSEAYSIQRELGDWI